MAVAYRSAIAPIDDAEFAGLVTGPSLGYKASRNSRLGQAAPEHPLRT
jgi:hypothetical protein